MIYMGWVSLTYLSLGNAYEHVYHFDGFIDSKTVSLDDRNLRDSVICSTWTSSSKFSVIYLFRCVFSQFEIGIYISSGIS